MKKSILITALIAAASFGGVAAAQATTNVPANADVQTTRSNTAAVQGDKQVPAPGSRYCIRDTGSHIPPPKGGCLHVSGISYSHEELERTGSPTVGQALQQLDPRVTITGH
jgi:hypothetical protein